MGVYDINLKTGLGSCQGYDEVTFRDGDRAYATWEGKLLGKGRGEGRWTWIKGTGKYEGIKGGGTWVFQSVPPDLGYSDSEGEIILPTR